MATPPGGPYGNEYPAQPNGGGRFNFPSAPSGQGQDQNQNQNQWNGYDQGAQAQPYPGPTPEVRPIPAPAPGAAHPPGNGYPQERHPAGAPPRRPGDSETPQPLVRPYAMTGGRTRPRYQLAIEALVSTTADPVQLHGQLPEHQRICQLCYEVKSVAEVSALLTIPLGVARILVADLAEAGLVAIHQPGHDAEPGGQPDVTLLERVLSGLRKL
ncbi:DUF742 domain-containing protein [Streptomyces specialis]|uniref:DUF742 domain-containing protein n=1 Tax=Streptomyces specialis TaxID=498367 RepID=UPI00073EE99F|nr:DUF742 domain-containing protein [Streptomyces specialis]